MATWEASLPIAWRLYLPEIWASDAERRNKAGVPEEIGFRTKLEIALDPIRQAVQDGVSQGTVLADPAYGNDTGFREEPTGMELGYAAGMQSATAVWPRGTAPLSPPPWRGGRGRPAHRLRRDAEHAPVSAKQLALSLPAKAWKTVTWREGSQRPPRSRFAAVRFAPPIAIASCARPGPRNGCRSSGPAVKLNRANTGCPICLRPSRCANWWRSPSSAGLSNAIIGN